MLPASADLSALSRANPAAAAGVPRPPSRVLTRVVLPGFIVLAALGLLAYAARESFRSAIPVTVAPVVLRPGSASGSGGGGGGDPAAPGAPGEIVQAPGWIEADPSAIGVPALAGGVLKELPVLDGQRIEPGQVVALLVDEDAVLAKRRAQAGVENAAAMLAQSRAAVAVDEAKRDELEDEVSRKASALTGRGVSEFEVVSARLRLKAQNAAIESSRAAVARAESEAHAAQVALDEAALALSRMTVRAPVGGVVLQRLVEPGQRLMPDANNPMAGVVVRLYDPAHLQVRVDVPLADAAKVHVGDAAEITTETLPGRAFKGTLTRFVHEANIQKNTVQVKIAIADPAPELKPDMLAKAKIVTHQGGANHPTEPGAAAVAPANPVLLVPRAALLEISGDKASAWIVDRGTTTAAKRTVRLGQSSADSAEVLEGLRLGDRVILNPPADLKPGAKVQPAGEHEGH